jgi:hypothetical protein
LNWDERVKEDRDDLFFDIPDDFSLSRGVETDSPLGEKFSEIF